MTTESLALGLDIFAQGATRYFDHYPDDKEVRIVLNIYIANYSKPVSAIVDTGTPWCILTPLIFEKIAHCAEPIYALETPLNIRGFRYTGCLYQLPMRLEALIGEPLDIVATVFVPSLSFNEEWHYPNFIGLDGFLNRIRFAVDPANNLFYFGELV